MGDCEVYNYFYIVLDNKSEKHEWYGDEVHYCPGDIKYFYCLLAMSYSL